MEDQNIPAGRIYYLSLSALSATLQPNYRVIDLKLYVFNIADEGIGNGGDGIKAALTVIGMKTGANRAATRRYTYYFSRKYPTVISGKTLAVNEGKCIGCCRRCFNQGIEQPKDHLRNHVFG